MVHDFIKNYSNASLPLNKETNSTEVKVNIGQAPRILGLRIVSNNLDKNKGQKAGASFADLLHHY